MKTLNETKALMQKNDELTKKIKDFEEEIRINNERKKNAKDLTRLLKDEGIRWKETLSVIDKELDNFLGNIFLSSAIISYLSPFTGSYRKEQVQDWIKLCFKYNVKVSHDYSLETTISDPVEIRSWNINGLPSDTVSKENAIMLFNNPKFALMIDPQVQANTWLKKMFKQDKNDKNSDYIKEIKQKNKVRKQIKMMI
jgi:dynein heavy chain